MKKQNRMDKIIELIDRCIKDGTKIWNKPKYLYQLYQELGEETEARNRAYHTQCPMQFREAAMKVLEHFKSAVKYLDTLLYEYEPSQIGVPFMEEELFDELRWIKDRLILEDWRKR